MNRRAAWIVLLCAVLFGAWAVACAQNDAAAKWLGDVEKAHATADAAMKTGDGASARRVLEDAANAPVPAGVPERDARVLRQDLYARLALLSIAGGRPADAIAFADRGLALNAGARDVFVANLYIARGRARAAKGDDVAAARDYHEAIQISEGLLDEALGDGKDR